MQAVLLKCCQFNHQAPHCSSSCFFVFVFDNDKKKMPISRLLWEYIEDDMAEAILDITDNGFSPSQAAEKRGVPQGLSSTDLTAR